MKWMRQWWFMGNDSSLLLRWLGSRWKDSTSHFRGNRWRPVDEHTSNTHHWRPVYNYPQVCSWCTRLSVSVVSLFLSHLVSKQQVFTTSPCMMLKIALKMWIRGGKNLCHQNFFSFLKEDFLEILLSWRRILLMFSPLCLGPSERFSAVRSRRTPSAAARAWCPLSSTVPAAATCGLWPLGAAKGRAPATRTSWHCFRRKEARPPLEEPESLLWSFWKAQILWLGGSRSFQPPLHQPGREETQPVAKPTINERNGCWRILTRSFCQWQSYPSILLRYRYSRRGPLTNASNRITPTIDWPFALPTQIGACFGQNGCPMVEAPFLS